MRQREPHLLRRARRRELLRHPVPDRRHHLAGLQPLRRTLHLRTPRSEPPAPARGAAARIQGELQPPARDPPLPGREHRLQRGVPVRASPWSRCRWTDARPGTPSRDARRGATNESPKGRASGRFCAGRSTTAATSKRPPRASPSPCQRRREGQSAVRPRSRRRDQVMKIAPASATKPSESTGCAVVSTDESPMPRNSHFEVVCSSFGPSRVFRSTSPPECGGSHVDFDIGSTKIRGVKRRDRLPSEGRAVEVEVDVWTFNRRCRLL